MASPQEHAPLSTQSSPQETSSPRARPPRRPGMGSNGGEQGDVGVRCVALCFHLPSRSKKKPPPPVKFVPACKSPEELDASASQRVTFLASASLSTWWPSSPSAAAGAPGNDVAGRRMSAAATTSSSRRSGGGRRALSSSFSYWRRSTQSSSRVMPHGGAASARVSFSFPSSPVSVSSCMSTPKISHGCQE